MNNEILLVGFATAIGVLILLVIMENPESNLDRKLGCFNVYALSVYLKELLGRGQNFSMLTYSFGISNFMDERRADAEEMLRGILRIVNRKRKIMSFKNTNSEMVFISSNEDDLYQAGLELLNFFAKNEVWQKETRLALIKKCNVFTNSICKALCSCPTC